MLVCGDEQDETVPALLEVGPALLRSALHSHALRFAAHVELHGRAAHFDRELGFPDPGRQKMILLLFFWFVLVHPKSISMTRTRL